mgnify:CR=1 FL=1|jgi:hypothetical protein|tara:strand:- start:2520 stop:3350 length:831 start_codon:yes stop_codon:yes gene_type:complete
MIKKNIYKKIIKELLKGLRRIYWYNYTNIKYFFLSSKFLLLNNDVSTNKISLILPTRERSQKFERMLKSLMETCSDFSRIEILILLDSDDKETNDYNRIVNENKNNLDINIFILDLKTHAKRNNYLAKKCSGDLIFPINDDMIFVSDMWDHFLDIEFSKIDSKKPFCVWIDAGNRYRYFHCDFPIVNRKWYEKLNYIGSEHFNFWYLDRWICELSMKSNTFLLSNKVVVKQFSAHSLENEVDNTHLINIQSGNQSKDDVIWHNTYNERIIESKKLL